MRTLYQQFFSMTLGHWLLPKIKAAQRLRFPSRIFERQYDAKMGIVFLWVLVCMMVLILCKHWLLFPVVGLIAYAVHLHRFCRRHQITSAKQRARSTEKGDSK